MASKPKDYAMTGCANQAAQTLRNMVLASSRFEVTVLATVITLQRSSIFRLCPSTYYDEHHGEFVSQTLSVNMDALYEPFCQLLPKGASVSGLHLTAPSLGSD